MFHHNMLRVFLNIFKQGSPKIIQKVDHVRYFSIETYGELDDVIWKWRTRQFQGWRMVLGSIQIRQDRR